MKNDGIFAENYEHVRLGTRPSNLALRTSPHLLREKRTVSKFSILKCSYLMNLLRGFKLATGFYFQIF